MDEQRTFDDGVAATAAAHRTLCVVEADTVTLFSASGAIFVVPIPFKVGCVMPLDKGLLLERFVANADGNDGDDDGVGRRQTAGSASPVPSADSAGEPDLQPTMFTLLYGSKKMVTREDTDGVRRPTPSATPLSRVALYYRSYADVRNSDDSQ